MVYMYKSYINIYLILFQSTQLN